MTNIIVGGSFETFDSINVPHGWTGGGTTAQITQSANVNAVSDGGWCCRLNAPAACNIFQTVPTVGGLTYNLSFSQMGGDAHSPTYTIVAVGGASDGYYLQADGATFAAGANSFTYAASVNPTRAQQVQPAFLTPPNSTGLTLNLFNVSGHNIYIDNVILDQGDITINTIHRIGRGSAR